MEGGTLTDAVKDGNNFTENQVAYTSKELLKAIQYIHSQNFCHRDIKSENVKKNFKFQIFTFFFFSNF